MVAATAVPAVFSPTPLDNAGNGTFILLLSALASLSFVRDGRSTGTVTGIAALGLLAGLGL